MSAPQAGTPAPLPADLAERVEAICAAMAAAHWGDMEPLAREAHNAVRDLARDFAAERARADALHKTLTKYRHHTHLCASGGGHWPNLAPERCTCELAAALSRAAPPTTESK